MNIGNPLKSCSWCGRAAIISHTLYCPSCLDQLESLIRWREIGGLPFKIYSLFNLKEKRVHHLIVNLKGGRNPSVFADLSIRIWETMSNQMHTKPVFIPAPQKKFEDHATVFAKSLSLVWGGAPYWNGLHQESQSSQKELNRRERKKLWMKRYLPLPPRTLNHVFVDDVITTGSTALAAYRALGKPRSFALWTLAHMPLLSNP